MAAPWASWHDPLLFDEQLDEDERIIRETTRQFATDRLMPLIIDWNRHERFDPAIMREFGAMGFLGATIEGYGCAGIGHVAYGLIARELERVDATFRSAVGVQGGLAMASIHEFGSEAQRERFLPPMARGELIGCFGLTEPGSGSDPGAMRTRARSADGGFRLSGNKTWITHSPIADVFIVWARDEEDEVRGFVLEKGMEGLSAPKIEGKFGVRASPTGEIVLDDVFVPDANLLPEARGLRAPLRCLNRARFAISWGAIGAAEFCWHTARNYVLERHQFGHPVRVPAKVRGKVELYHWSWMFILTQADLLVSNEDIEDEDQRVILSEMIRFLTHPSAGVKGFDSMPAAWSEVVQKVTAGAPLQAKSEEVHEVVGAWHQEVRDLSLVLTRQLGVTVRTKLPRAHASDPAARAKADAAQLADSHTLTATLAVPAAAAPVDLAVDVAKRTISASMMLRAPTDKKSTKARVNWLLRQIQKAPDADLHIRLYWPGRAPHTQHMLAELREDPDLASEGNADRQPHSLEVCMIRQLAGRFGQRKNFVADLEHLAPAFYETVGQHLKAYQPPAPRVREDRTEPESVNREALQQVAEAEALSNEGE